MATYIAFADDFGDPGTGGRGTAYFGWSAFIIPSADVARFELIRPQLTPLNTNTAAAVWHALGWDSHDVFGALSVLNAVDDWYWIAVASDTRTAIPAVAPIIANPTKHRYFTVQWLLHRLSWFADERNASIEVQIDDPGPRMHESTLRREYMHWNAGGRGPATNRLPAADIHFAAPADQPLLNIADLIAHACFDAVNPHPKWSRTYDEEVEAIRDRLWVGPVWGRRSVTLYGFMAASVCHTDECDTSATFRRALGHALRDGLVMTL